MSESTETQKRECADSEGEKDGVASKKPKIESCAKGSDDNGVKEPSFLVEADAAEDKGSRLTMEDAWVVLLDASLDYPGKLRCAHFAIYDGHGGRLAAEYAQKHLHRNVLSAGLPPILTELHCLELRFIYLLYDAKATKRSILNGFLKTDESLLQESAEVTVSRGWQDGATAVCVWVLGQRVAVAHIGDAKAVLARSTEGSQNPDVRGFVSPDGRLLGRLEVSRAFGDRQFKKVGLVASPDVYTFEVTNTEHFIILGCDGLWGVFGPSDAVDFVQKLLNEGLPVATVCRRLVREAVRERRCKDNCTAIIIVFKHK
ncbi:hypothetical protein ACSQ67_009309 [Phaseolus vulgaris]